MKNEAFGRLVKMAISTIAIYEGKNAITVEEEIGNQVGVSGSSIQRYKSGHIPPSVETVGILAEAGVKRAFLSQDWAINFLREADYPYPGRLLDTLFPKSDEKGSTERIFSNLPSPTYSRFIHRPQVLEQIITGLTRRSAVVLILSLGGFGKSSSAREVAEQSLGKHDRIPHFNAAVWVSDKGKEGTTTLNVVLDEIAYTLEYPGLVGLPFAEKKREVEKLLRFHKTLLIIDNAETVTDMMLIQWLLNDLPEPSKAIVTSREYNRVFRNSTFLVELRGLAEAEAQEFVELHLELLSMQHLVTAPNQLDELTRETGGNPKALEIALGYIKHRHQPLTQVLEDLKLATGEIFDDLFNRCWNLLSVEAQTVLMTMCLFPDGANPDALSEVSGVRGGAFRTDIEHLTELSLLDVHQKNLIDLPLYTLHQLVYTFASSKLKENPKLQTDIRNRWIHRYEQIATNIGFAWKDIERLKALDAPGESAAMLSVIEWSFNSKRYHEAIQISKNVRYYYYVRGYWSNERSINVLRARAAQALSEVVEEFDALVYHINIASKQANLHEVSKFLPRLSQILDEHVIPDTSLIQYRHAKALYLMEKGDLQAAHDLWEENFKEPEKLSEHDNNANRRWAAFCLHKMGEVQKAHDILSQLVEEAMRIGFHRGALSARIRLAQIEIELDHLEVAEKQLDEIVETALNIKDQMYIADIYSAYGDLFIAKSENQTAKEYLDKAIDIYRRLGHSSKLQDAETKQKNN